MLSFRELEQITLAILENTTQEERQQFLGLDHDSRFLWVKHKIASMEAQT